MKFWSVNGKVVWCWKFCILVISWFTFKVVALLIFSKIISLAFFSKTIEQPKGKWGKSSSISFKTEVVVLPIKALNLFSKSYSGLEFPTKSSTV